MHRGKVQNTLKEKLPTCFNGYLKYLKEKKESQRTENINMRNTSKFNINVWSETPLSDILEVSKFLDSLDNTKLPLLTERDMLEIFHRFIIDTSDTDLTFPKNSLIDFIDYFNTAMIDRFLNNITDEEYKDFEAKWLLEVK